MINHEITPKYSIIPKITLPKVITNAYTTLQKNEVYTEALFDDNR